ncbi:MAG: nicotinate-nucleotide adenylyltransferase [Sphingomonadaceae bacterium]
MARGAAVRIGVFGGTFDPIHLGHLVAAQEVLYALRLDRVLFVPAGEPPHKQPGGASPTAHRVRMVELAIRGNPRFELSLVDVSRPGRSYTVDTLRILRADMGPEAELFFIIGMDSLAELATWKDPATLISLCRLAVVDRPPYKRVMPSDLEGRLPGISRLVDIVDMPGIDVSATELRRRVAVGAPIKYLVPEAVERYIAENGLYQGARSSQGGVARDPDRQCSYPPPSGDSPRQEGTEHHGSQRKAVDRE